LEFDNVSDKRVFDEGGQKVWRMSEDDIYSPNLIVLANEIVQTEILDIEVSLKFHCPGELKEDEVLLVLSIEDDGQVLRYEKKDLVCVVSEWEEIYLNTLIPANLPESAIIKMYIWNKNKKSVEFSRLSVTVVGK
jgi:hypothetical protein